jgi:AraC-type DNA-binding domain-containing proteins
MRTLNEIKPYVGDSMRYLYVGGWNEKLRVSNVYAFHLFVDGPGEMEVNGKLYPIDRRTLIFLRPGEPHAFHIRKGQPLSSYNLYCDMWDGSASTYNRGFIHAPEPFLLDSSPRVEPCPELDTLPSCFSLQPYPWLYDSFVSIGRQFEDSAHYRAELVNSLLYAWMLSWYNAIHSRQPKDFRIVKLLAHLNEHPETRSQVEDWAAMCGLKRSYFHSLFQRETGFTPQAYRHRLLMKQAAQLLVETDYSVTAIAERLGYTSIHPFTRHFTAFHGVSPRYYRLQPSSERDI